MAEIGLLASIVQVADIGLRLSLRLYAFGETVASADRSISAISNDVSLTSSVLKELGDLLKSDTSRIYSDNAVKTADAVVRECSKAFTEMDEMLLKKVPQLHTGDVGKQSRASLILERLRWPAIKGKIELLRVNLDRMKSTLTLMLNVIIYAKQVSESKESPAVLSDQRQLIEDLAKANQDRETEFNELRLALEGAHLGRERPTTTSQSSPAFTTSLVALPQTKSQDAEISTGREGQLSDRTCPSPSEPPLMTGPAVRLLLDEFTRLHSRLLTEVRSTDYKIEKESRARYESDITSRHTQEINEACESKRNDLNPPAGCRRTANTARSSNAPFVKSTNHFDCRAPGRSSREYVSVPRTSNEPLDSCRMLGSRQRSPPRMNPVDTTSRRPLIIINSKSPTKTARPIITRDANRPSSPLSKTGGTQLVEEPYIIPASSSSGRYYYRYSSLTAGDKLTACDPLYPATRESTTMRPPLHKVGRDDRDYAYEYTTPKEQVIRDLAPPQKRPRHESYTAARPTSMINLDRNDKLYTHFEKDAPPLTYSKGSTITFIPETLSSGSSRIADAAAHADHIDLGKNADDVELSLELSRITQSETTPADVISTSRLRQSPISLSHACASDEPAWPPYDPPPPSDEPAPRSYRRTYPANRPASLAFQTASPTFQPAFSSYELDRAGRQAQESPVVYKSEQNRVHSEDLKSVAKFQSSSEKNFKKSRMEKKKTLQAAADDHENTDSAKIHQGMAGNPANARDPLPLILFDLEDSSVPLFDLEDSSVPIPEPPDSSSLDYDASLRIPFEIQAPTQVPDEKRYRNATASNSFRQRRKEKEKEQEAANEIKRLEQQAQDMADQRDSYQRKVDALQNALTRQGTSLSTLHTPHGEPCQEPQTEGGDLESIRSIDYVRSEYEESEGATNESFLDESSLEQDKNRIAARKSRYRSIAMSASSEAEVNDWEHRETRTAKQTQFAFTESRSDADIERGRDHDTYQTESNLGPRNPALSPPSRRRRIHSRTPPPKGCASEEECEGELEHRGRTPGRLSLPNERRRLSFSSYSNDISSKEIIIGSRDGRRLSRASGRVTQLSTSDDGPRPCSPQREGGSPAKEIVEKGKKTSVTEQVPLVNQHPPIPSDHQLLSEYSSRAGSQVRRSFDGQMPSYWDYPAVCAPDESRRSGDAMTVDSLISRWTNLEPSSPENSLAV